MHGTQVIKVPLAGTAIRELLLLEELQTTLPVQEQA
jgi:hypothetical protein